MFNRGQDYLIDAEAPERTKKMFLTSVVLSNATRMALAQKLAKTDEQYAYNLLQIAMLFGFQNKKMGRLTQDEVYQIGRCAELILTFADLKVRTIRFHADAFEILRKVPDPDLGKAFTRETYRMLEEAVENYKELYGLDNEGMPRKIYLDKRGYQDRIDVELLIKIAHSKGVQGFGFFKSVRDVMLTLEPKGKTYFGKGAKAALLQGEAPVVETRDKNRLKKYLGMSNTILCYR